MTTAAIRQKLSDYMMNIADDKKVKAIYAMVEEEINTAENDWDEYFIKELKNRSKRIVGGTGKAYTWEETKQAAIQKVRAAKSLKK